MKRKAFIIAGALVLLIVVLAVALPWLINVNRFRPVLEREMTAALGREVSIGNLELSLFAGGIAVEEISIADDPRYSREPFLKAGSLTVGVRLWPLLLSRSLHVDSLTIGEPQVLLLRSPSGKWNFSTLGGQDKKDAAKNDSGQTAFSVSRLRIVDGRVTVGDAGSKQRYTYEKVNVTARDIAFDSETSFTAEAVPPGGGSIQVEGEAGPLNRADAARSPLKATVKVEGLNLTSTGFLDPKSGLAGVLDYEGKLESDGKTAQAEGRATANQLRVVRGGTPAPKPVVVDYATEYDLERKRGTLNKGNIIAGKTAAVLSGNYQGQRDTTVLHLKLRGDDLPVDEVQGLLPAFGVVLPPGASLRGGVVDADLAIDGPLERLVTSGTVSVSNTALANFDLGAKMAAISALSGVRPGKTTDIELMTSQLRVSPEGVQAQTLKLVMPAIGTLTGQGTISGDNALDFKMRAQLAQGMNVATGLSSLTSLGQSKGAIPFLIKGTTSNPVFIPDVRGALGDTVAAPQQGAEGVGGLLKGLFGKKKSD